MFSTPVGVTQPRSQQSAGFYRQVGLDTAAGDASPHELVRLLFEGLFIALHKAQRAIASGEKVARANAIGQAVRIVNEGLKPGLDLGAGGKLAADLRDLYTYVCMRLTQANANHDAPALDECIRLLQPLRDAWGAIRPTEQPRSIPLNYS